MKFGEKKISKRSGGFQKILENCSCCRHAVLQCAVLLFLMAHAHRFKSYRGVTRKTINPQT
jgi:hypothetical protein